METGQRELSPRGVRRGRSIGPAVMLAPDFARTGFAGIQIYPHAALFAALDTRFRECDEKFLAGSMAGAVRV